MFFFTTFLLAGMTTPLLKEFFQLLGNISDIFLPFLNLKCWERFKGLLESLNPLKVLCSGIIPNLSIVKQNLFFGAKNKPEKVRPDL